MSIKKGFTMTELLVTMGIIGVLAAIMIPTFYRSKPNSEKLMLQKSYHTIGRVIYELVNDDRIYPDDEDDDEYGSKSGFSNTIEKSYHGVTAKGESKFCAFVASKLNVSSANVDCSGDRSLSASKGGNFTTSDGVTWSLPYSDFENGKKEKDSKKTIEIDVNGKDKGPNCFEKKSGNKCASGQAPDRFEIYVDRWGKISIPDDDITGKYLNETNSTASYKDLSK